MSTTESASTQSGNALWAICDGSPDGLLIVEIETRRLLRANPSMCEMLGYSEKELLTLTVDDIHPRESLPYVLDRFEAISRHGLKCAREVPCLRKDGSVLFADVAATRIAWEGRPCVAGFFHDTTEQKKAIEGSRAVADRCRLITENVVDVIWTIDFPKPFIEQAWTQEDMAAAVDVILNQSIFSYVSPAVERIFHYSTEEACALSLRDIMTADSLNRVRNRMTENLSLMASGSTTSSQWAAEVEVLAKDGTSRWCEVLSSYVRDARGALTGMIGITRDVTARLKAERALRESESKLRGLFENLPDLVVMIDHEGHIRFVNREQPQYNGESLLGRCGFDLIAPEHEPILRLALDRAISTGSPQIVETQDTLGAWWACRFVPLGKEADDDGARHAMAICTDITQQRRATEAIRKEQQLLRRLLDLHERERQMIAYEIHDGFAQQLTGALYRLQGFREVVSKTPAEAWKMFDSAAQLLTRAVDETRRLISGLRPPILDEMGVFDAVQYLVYEQRKDGGPEIVLDHDASGERFPPPLENAVFRIVQESLNNACRHSRSDKIRVSLARRGNRICIEVRDWGVGFEPSAVATHRFGLQGIRERTRLLDGTVAIESAPGKGTRVIVELPLADTENSHAVIFDMDGVLVDSYHAHYQSWKEVADEEGLQITEAEFAVTFGRTSREIIARLWGSDRYDDAQIAELDRRKEAAYRRIIEARFPAMSGAVELLHVLHAAGFRLALGSSGPPENVAVALDGLGTRDLFEAVVTGEDVVRGKPDPEVFLTAARRLGVPPANCAVVEDASAGVEAANAAGMTSIGLLSDGRNPDDVAAAGLVVRSLTELSPQVVHDAISRRSTRTAISEKEFTP
jgi:beta-phosphoglucomutase